MLSSLSSLAQGRSHYAAALRHFVVTARFGTSSFSSQHLPRRVTPLSWCLFSAMRRCNSCSVLSSLPSPCLHSSQPSRSRLHASAPGLFFPSLPPKRPPQPQPLRSLPLLSRSPPPPPRPPRSRGGAAQRGLTPAAPSCGFS